MLYFLLLRAPDGTDLLTASKGEGSLPFFQPFIVTPASNPLTLPSEGRIPSRIWMNDRRRAGC